MLETEFAFAVEGDGARFSQHRQSLAGDHALPAGNVHGAHHAGCNRRVQAQQGFASAVRELNRQATGLQPPYGLQQAADCRQSNRLGIGKGQIQRNQRVGLPQRACTQAVIVGDGCVDDSDVAPGACACIFDAHLYRFVACQRLGARDAPAGKKPDGHPSDRGLAHLGKGVVRARRQPGNRHGTVIVNELARHRAMGAVAAQNHDRRHAHALQKPGRGERVLDRGRGLHIQELDGRQRVIGAAPDMALQKGADTTAVGHDPGPLDATGRCGAEQSKHDVHPIGDLQVSGIGHNAPDVARRYGVGDNTNAGFKSVGHASHTEVPRA